MDTISGCWTVRGSNGLARCLDLREPSSWMARVVTVSLGASAPPPSPSTRSAGFGAYHARTSFR